MTLYNKYRPATLYDVVGQEHITKPLLQAIRKGKISHAYLFVGPAGTGKTSTARAFARTIMCNDPKDGGPCGVCQACKTDMDLVEIDGASNSGVDNIRDLRTIVNNQPVFGNYVVFIIDEVHMLSTSAFNALLKTLEEPPKHTIFILATTALEKLPKTIISRCLREDFRPLSVETTVGLMERVAEGESFSAEHKVLELVAERSNGNMRDALNYLEQLIAADATTDAAARKILGAVPENILTEFVDVLRLKDKKRGLLLIAKAMRSGTDPQQFVNDTIISLRSMLVGSLTKGFVSPIPERDLIYIIKKFSDIDIYSGVYQQLPIEVAFIEAVNHMKGQPVDEW